MHCMTMSRKKKIILQHGNTQPHTTCLCVDRIQKNG
jgi:hypothetical protein